MTAASDKTLSGVSSTLDEGDRPAVDKPVSPPSDWLAVIAASASTDKPERRQTDRDFDTSEGGTP